MLSLFLTPLLSALSPARSAAQGRIIIRPCPIPCPRGDCGLPPDRCGDRTAPPRVERTATQVRVTLADRVLRYEVTESFRNLGGNLGEADYIFPLPTNAAFEDVRLEINGEMVAGETFDAGEARAEYERIVREQRDPALVEWMGAGMLRARIFPFRGGEQRTVAVRYQQVAPREGDVLRVEFRRPDADDSSPVRALTASTRARNTLELELPTAGYGEPYSPTHDLTVRREGNHRIAEVRGNARDVVVLVPVARNAAAAIGVLTHAAGPQEKFALITVAPPPAGLARSARDITFVLDVSGSMGGIKLVQAKAAGKQLLNTLTADDRFRLVDFATDVHTFRDSFVFATAANIRAAEQYLDNLRAEGSTNISGALMEALDAASRESTARLSLMLFVTDGEPTVGIRTPAAIADSVRSWRRGVRLFTFGLGADVNSSLVEQLAIEGRGLAQFVRPDESVERTVGLVASRLQRPVLTDVRIEGDGVRLLQPYPSTATDLYAGQELVLLTRYEGSGRGAIRVTGQSATGRVTWRTDAVFPERSNTNAFVPRLWATQRVGWLSAQRRRDGASPELDDEIRTLGLRYGIPTELTSYMVREPRLTPGNVSRSAAGSGSPLASPPPAGRSLAADANAQRGVAFEQAKAASAQRTAMSMVTVDSLADAAAQRNGSSASDSRIVLNRRFQFVDSVWVDSRAVDADTAKMWTLRVQAYSPAWFTLLRTVPALKEAFALGAQVRIAGRSVLLDIAPRGVTTLDDATVRRFGAAW